MTTTPLDVRGEEPVAVQSTHGTLEAGIRSRISGLLAASCIPADEVHCRFHTTGQRLDIELVLPVEVSRRVKHALAVRVLDAVRTDERTYGRVDLQVTAADG